MKKAKINNQITQLNDELTKLKSECSSLRDSLQEKAFQIKINEKEFNKKIDLCQIKILERFLSVRSILQIFLKKMGEEDSQTKYLFSHINSELESVFKEYSFEIIDSPASSEYNPLLHEVVSFERTKDLTLKNIIIESYSVGYKYKDQIIKYQKVKVYKI